MNEHPLLKALAENEACERAMKAHNRGKGKNVLGQALASVDADEALARYRAYEKYGWPKY